jgi:prevent-host-death family protein
MLANMQVNIADFKAHLSDYLDKTEHGEEIILCRYGKSVAKIVPVAGKTENMTKLGVLRGTGKWLADPSEPLIPPGSRKMLR